MEFSRDSLIWDIESDGTQQLTRKSSSSTGPDMRRLAKITDNYILVMNFFM